MATSWPPKSPKAALLSSPSGRRKHQQYQNHQTTHSSPLKQRVTRPNLQRTSQFLLENAKDFDLDDMEEDEDEETLQLKLAAIEAKLKLKKLQQIKTRSQAGLAEATAQPQSIRPTTTSPLHEMNGQEPTVRARESAVEIPISPMKKSVPSAEQRSPGRVLLGIDKGIRGNDVSLRRARSTHKRTFPQPESRLDRPIAWSSAFTSLRPNVSPAEVPGGRSRTFSERVAETRSVERSKEDQREATTKNRRTGFKLNQAELESLRLAAEEARTHDPPRPVKHHEQVDFRRDDILRFGQGHNGTSTKLKRRQITPSFQSPLKKPVHPSEKEDSNSIKNDEVLSDTFLFEPLSQLNLSTRLLPHTFLQRTIPEESFTPLRLSQLLKEVHAPLYELPVSIVDYVVFGIIALKSAPHNHEAGMGTTNLAKSAKGGNEWQQQWEDGSQNCQKFMVLQLTDLTWSVDLFLFGTALPRYHRLSVGTVVAILNPGIMPPKKGKEDTGAFSLTLHSGDETVLEIGYARDLGFCKAIKKDGKECGSWVNSTKMEFCEWHLNVQVSKAQAGRMGVNTGSNGSGLGRGGGDGRGAKNSFRSAHVTGQSREARERQANLPRKEGQRFDTYTGSHYFIGSSGGGSSSAIHETPAYHSGQSAANLLDVDEEDPFVTAGALSRDKESRLRKQLVAEEKERGIARNLGQMNSGGAGGEYIRRRLGVDVPPVSEQGSQRAAMATKVGIMNFDPAGNGNGKRSAQSVRLSPVKKTRLLTEKGIRLPGRESLGTKSGLTHVGDDDLDIV